MSFGKGLLIVIGVVFVLAMVGKLTRESSPGTKTTQATRADPTPMADQASTRRRSDIPAAPPPSYAHLAHEVPSIEATLAANPTYASIWEPQNDQRLMLFLTAVSEGLAEQEFSGPVLDALNRTGNKNLKDAAVKICVIYPRIGRFPTAFQDRASRYLDEVKGQPRLGSWTPWTGKRDEAPHDFTALAVWLRKDQPEYLRERFEAKRHGPMSRWRRYDKPRELPYLSDEKAALERLALLSPLSPDEARRLFALRNPAVEVAARALWRAYHANEVAADEKYKGKALLVLGEIASIDKNLGGEIIVQLKTPNAFEHIHAYMQSEEKSFVAKLTKGDVIKPRCIGGGMVLASPVLLDCVID